MTTARSSRFAVAALLLPVALSGCACTTVGYLDVGPIPVVLDGDLPSDAEVTACLDSGCAPTLVPEVNGLRFEIPQEEPYRSTDAVNPPTVARVVVTAADGETLIDQEVEIRTGSDNPISVCPGEFHYEDVVVSIP